MAPPSSCKPRVTSHRQRYELRETLHEGPQRTVFRVAIVDRPTQGTRVMKVVAASAPPEALTGIREEYLLLQRLRHPHLIRVHEFLVLPDGSQGYVMEDLPGASPKGVESPGWGPRDLESVRSLLGALACVHAVGYAHLDLKPSQVRYAEDGSARLLDLGLAAPIGSSIATRGTWGSIAPEILCGGPWDHRADIYGLGSLIAQVWTGQHPMGDGEFGEQLRRAMDRPRLRLRDRVEGIPEGLDRIIEGFLEPDPASRPKDARTAWRALQQLSGCRQNYLERQKLPSPQTIPWVSPDGVEADWIRDVQDAGRGTVAWCIAGPIGSGRRRMLDRFRALAETEGVGCRAIPGGLQFLPDESREILCTIVEHSDCADTRVVDLTRSGEGQAAAALAAFGLEAEGHEPDWTRGLLELRLRERTSAVAVQYAVRRTRRSWAAAMGAKHQPDVLVDGAIALAAEESVERPAGSANHPLVTEGWFRCESDRLVPATPPWRRDELEAMVGRDRVATAHRTLLSHGGNAEQLARVRHALACADDSVILGEVLAAATILKNRGDLAGAVELILSARERTASELSAELLAKLGEWAWHEGASDLYLRVLRVLPEDAPWAVLIRARLAIRDRQHSAALELACAAQARTKDYGALAAATIVESTVYSINRDQASVFQKAEALLKLVENLSEVDRGWYYATLLETCLEQGARSADLDAVADVCKEYLERGLNAARYRIVSLLGDMAFLEGAFERAGRYYHLLVEEAQRSRNDLRIADARLKAGGVLFENGRLEESRIVNEDALRLYRSVQRVPGQARAQSNIAVIDIASGAYAHAIDVSLSARDLRAQEPGKVAFTLGLEFCALVRSGMYVRAAEVLAESRADSFVRATWIDRIGFYREAGNLFRRVGNVEAARREFREALCVFKAQAAHDELIRCACDWYRGEAAWGGAHAYEPLKILESMTPRGSSRGETALIVGFTTACRMVREGSGGGARAARVLLSELLAVPENVSMLPWSWLVHAAVAALANHAGDRVGAVESTEHARTALTELIGRIDNAALQDSFILSPDPQAFLAWLDGDDLIWNRMQVGSSDLELFLRFTV